MAAEQPDPQASPPAHDPREFEASFDALVREHYVRLTSFAYRLLHSWDAAEDAVQEVLYKTWKRRTAVSFRAPLPYLYQAVRNECLMVLRQQQRRGEPESDATDVPAPTTVPGEDADVQAAVDRAIAALPERCRLIFTMSREQELSYRDIADVLGISVKTVETQMGRALRSLRRALAEYLCAAVVMLGGWG